MTTMTIDPIYSMALATGFLGSGHCLGMCGGLISALSIALAGRQQNLLFQGLYHLGRLVTYSLIGALVGWLGSVLAYANQFHGLMRLALVGSDCFIIVVGLGTAGLFHRLNVMGLNFPGPVQAITRASLVLIRRPSAFAALPLGLLMGFLPCGFLYSMIITATQTASLAKGSLTLLFFGLGTTPALFLFGSSIDWLSQQARSWMLRAAGCLVAAMGGYHLSQHITLLGWTFSGPLGFSCH
jgi:sulfite exporter TauE/SafE